MSRRAALMRFTLRNGLNSAGHDELKSSRRRSVHMEQP